MSTKVVSEFQTTLKEIAANVDKKELAKYSFLGALAAGAYYAFQNHTIRKANPCQDLKYPTEVIGIDQVLCEALVKLQDYANVEQLYTRNYKTDPHLFADAVYYIDSLIKVEICLADDTILPNNDTVNRATICYENSFNSLQQLLIIISNEMGVEHGVTAKQHVEVICKQIQTHYSNVLRLYKFIDLNKVQARAKQDIESKLMQQRILMQQQKKHKRHHRQYRSSRLDSMNVN